MKVIPRSTLQVFALIGAALVLCDGVVARDTKIPWKINKSIAQRLAAEGHYGADKGLEYFDYDSNGGSFFVFDGLTKPPAEGSVLTLICSFIIYVKTAPLATPLRGAQRTNLEVDRQLWLSHVQST